MAMDRGERIEGGIWGLLIGDALGVPYEFHRASEIPALDKVEFEPPKGFRRAHGGTPPGTWSDDGAHALCLLASLIERGRMDAEDLGRRLLDWSGNGYLAVDRRVFDMGIQTGHALANLRRGVPALQAGLKGEMDNGNGSLMRVLPLALWHRGADAELVNDAMAQSRVTHGHLRSQVCCALYCLWARRTMEGAADPWREAVKTLRALHAADDAATAELELHVRPDDDGAGQGGGYVVDCLRSARHVIGAGGYEAVVKAAVALGNDTDTTACVAGGMAGVRDGVAAIPQRWRTALRDPDGVVQPLVSALVEHAR